MSNKIIIDHEKTETTIREVPVFPWIRHDAGKFITEEALIDGNYAALHYSGMGFTFPREWIYNNYATIERGTGARFYKNHLLSFELEVDGQHLKDFWKWVDGTVEEKEDGLTESSIELRHDLVPVTVKVHTALDGTGFMQRWLEITNTGTEAMAISGLFPWCGIIFTEDLNINVYNTTIVTKDNLEYSLGRYKNNNWCMEGEFFWEKIPDGTLKIENNKAVKFSPSFYIVKNEDTGENFVIDFEYPGGVTVEFSVNRPVYNKYTLPWRGKYLHAKVGLAGSPPLRVLAPGETAVSPRVHFSMLFGDLDDCVNELHRHLRKSAKSICPWEEVIEPIEYSHGAYHDSVPTNKAILRNEIDIAAEIGADLFIMDSGWYGKDTSYYEHYLGDWDETPGLENGLREMLDYARSKKMRIGMWFPFEIVGEKSRIITEHADWLLKDVDRKLTMLNITKSEVETHVFNTVCSIIDKYQLDTIRLDGTGEHLTTFNRINGKYLENLIWRYYDVLYSLFDRLKARYPYLVIENCWGGGGRSDLGMMKQCCWIQISDNWHPEEQLRIFNGMSLAIPPEQCMPWPGACSVNAVDPDFAWRAAIFGHFGMSGLSPTLQKANDDLYDCIKRAIEIYKKDMRPLLANCRIFHHTPVQIYDQKGEWIVIENASEDRCASIVGLFRLSNGSNDFQLKVRGIDISKNYRVWHDNHRKDTTMSGWQLCSEGLSITVPGPMMSELLIIKAV